MKNSIRHYHCFSTFGDLLSLSAISFSHFSTLCGMMSEAFTHVLPPSPPPLLYIRRFQVDLNISNMTFTKANNSYGINCYQSCWEQPGKVIVARWETGTAVVGGKLNDLHASAAAPFMSLIQVQAYPFSPSHQTCTRPSVSPRFALFHFPWANNMWTPATLNDTLFVVQSWRCKSVSRTQTQTWLTDTLSLLAEKGEQIRACAQRPGIPFSLPLPYLSCPAADTQLSDSGPAEVCLCCKMCRQLPQAAAIS